MELNINLSEHERPQVALSDISDRYYLGAGN